MTQGSNLCLLHWQVDPFTTAPPTPSFKSECQPHWLQISFDPCTLTLFLLIITLYFGVKAFYFPCCQLECYPPGSSAHEILQTRILEWVAMPSSRGSSRPRDQTCVPCLSFVGRQIKTVPPGKPCSQINSHKICTVFQQ